MESEDETNQLRSAVLKTATSVLQIRQRADQEIRRANEVLEQRTRELEQALVIMRATLESTTDAILVIDEKGEIAEFNENYIDMWRIPREVLEGGMEREMRGLASQNFAEPQRFLARIEEITVTDQESFDLLELKDDTTGDIVLRPTGGAAVMHVALLGSSKTWCVTTKGEGTEASIPGDFAAGVYAISVEGSGSKAPLAYQVVFEQM